jgi:hypothetical protein
VPPQGDEGGERGEAGECERDRGFERLAWDESDVVKRGQDEQPVGYFQQRPEELPDEAEPD